MKEFNIEDYLKKAEEGFSLFDESNYFFEEEGEYKKYLENQIPNNIKKYLDDDLSYKIAVVNSTSGSLFGNKFTDLNDIPFKYNYKKRRRLMILIS
jgi:hypothetical protein